MNEVPRTKKIKSNKNKKDLWNKFDEEFNEKPDIECIYRECGEREKCELCEGLLIFTDEGFLTCQNQKCGIIYKDIIDQFK